MATFPVLNHGKKSGGMKNGIIGSFKADSWLVCKWISFTPLLSISKKNVFLPPSLAFQKKNVFFLANRTSEFAEAHSETQHAKQCRNGVFLYSGTEVNLEFGYATVVQYSSLS